LILKSSNFFAIATNGRWKESEDSCVYLAESTPEIFNLYLNYLYTHILHLDLCVPSTSSNTTVVDECEALVKGFRLGDFVQDTSFTDMVTDSLL
ncbi:hypothetical protein GQ43DRAFT_336485, partial [Delitschia confertaspora ATCC 74209]